MTYILRPMINHLSVHNIWITDVIGLNNNKCLPLDTKQKSNIW